MPGVYNLLWVNCTSLGSVRPYIWSLGGVGKGAMSIVSEQTVGDYR